MTEPEPTTSTPSTTPTPSTTGERLSTDRPPGPVVRLPTWVNVVLVLILLASCGAANNAVSFSDDAATRDDVRDLCRLLGVMAEKEAVDLEQVLADHGSATACREGLQQR